MTLVYGSVCSGIEAASVAWKPLGWRAAFVSEIEAFPIAVLKHRHGAVDVRETGAAAKAYQAGGVPLWGDFTSIWPRHLKRLGICHAIDLLVGGTPCQPFSIAGQRGGLSDARGNLALEYLRLARRLKPRWMVWENVPGVLSSGGGRDFGAILGGMVELGYGFAWRVLDAQYFGVPQRRRRVFLVGYLGDWRRPAAVLLERASLQGRPPPRRKAGKDVAGTIGARPSAGGGLGTDFELDGGVIEAFDARQRDVITYGDRTGPLDTDGYTMAAALGGDSVRRLTPRECERLQGFPDDFTLVPFRGKPAADGPRYRALGNSMAVPVMRWLGERIAAVEALGAPLPIAAE